MAQKVVNKALGLYSFKNNLTVPDGAMAKADNVVIDRDGIIEPRRGFGLHSDFGLSSDRAKQLLQYKDRLLVHYGTTLMYEESDGSFTAFDGIYTELESGLRIKGIENSGNYYFTTSEGVKKISATSSSDFSSAADYITDAGAVRALDVQGTPIYTGSVWLPPNNVVAYRVVWAYNDKNSNLILGYPSEVSVVRNRDAANTASAQLNITIPSEIGDANNLGYFCQIYRSSLKDDPEGTTAPDSEFQLVSEEFPDTSQNTFIVDDITPEDFRLGGALLYTNEISGEGILQANSRPPLCTDIEYFKGSTFYSNTSTRHNKIINLLSNVNFATGVTKLVIGDGSQITEYTFVGSKQTSTIDFSGYPATITKADFNGTYFFVRAANDIRQYAIWFDITGSDPTPNDIETSGMLLKRVDINTLTDGVSTRQDLLNLITPVIDFEVDFDVTNTATIITIINTANGLSSLTENSANNPIPASITFPAPILGTGEDIDQKQILLSDDPSVGIEIEETARSIVRVINGNQSEVCNAYYISASDEVQGSMNFERKTTLDSEFYLAISNDIPSVADNFNPILPIYYTTAANKANIAINTNKLVVEHGVSPYSIFVGDEVRIYNESGLNIEANGLHKVTAVSTNFSFTVDLPSEVLAAESGEVTFFKKSVDSDNEVKPNRIYYSKNGISEAVPTLNYFDVGSKDKSIDRIVALRDSLFILKEDGVYRLSGNDAKNFNVVLFDNSSPIIAADSPAVLNNQIYMLSTQGVITITDSGVTSISRNIEDLILDPTSNNFPSFSTQCFGMSSENDRAYFLHLPTEVNDTTATQCFRYNVFTSAWTRWDIAKNCGIVKDADDKIYFGASDINYIEQERKNFKRSDYADRQSSNNINAQITDTTMEMSTVAGIEKFDAIYQEQYITVARFNRLLSTLDTDPTLVYGGTGNSYTEAFMASIGADLSTLLSALITQVDSDDSTRSYTPSSGTNDKDILRDDFNQFTLELNTSDGVFLLSYPTFTSLVKYEDIVADVTAIGNIVTFTVATPFVVGVVTVYKAIPTSIEYVPENLGDTSLMKHFREATMMFNNYAFTFGEMGFRSDVSASLELQLFLGDGNGDYGTPGYGDAIYGGASNSRPFRTYIPRNKQRCRFIVIAFNHDAARESFEITGYSVTYNESTTERAYKD